MESVTGIGGLFFKAENPTRLARWYEMHLGVKRTGETYEEGSWWQESGPTVFAPFSRNSEPSGRGEQHWMVNFRVRDLEAMIAQLRESGIDVREEGEAHPNGRFAHLEDPEGNPIELWEPAGHDLFPPGSSEG